MCHINIEENKEPEKENHIGCGIALVIFVLTVFVISWLVIRFHYADETDFYAARGTFGDQFGAVNALFSALAFAGLIYTIILQMNELRYQREELIDNRKEMVRQTREFKQQNAALKKQTFENTFFNMLSLQQQIVNELSITEQQKYGLNQILLKEHLLMKKCMIIHIQDGRFSSFYISIILMEKQKACHML